MFANKVVLIAGASSGIGEALARAFAREGARLALLARRLDRLEDLAAEVRSSGGEAIGIACDVTRDGDVERAMAAAVERFGRIDVAVANAGFGVVGRFEDLALEDYRRQLETNVFGLLRTARAAIPELKKTRGVLALMGSVAGHVSAPGASAYSMSKFAVRAFAGSLRGELAPAGVAVVLISPGFVESEFRQVDNSGVRHPEAPEPVPGWLLMPVERAARDMLRAIRRRKGERIITFHGKVIVFLARHFPRFTGWAIGKRRVRPEPR
jgi:short-subunit dehydrogenase